MLTKRQRLAGQLKLITRRIKMSEIQKSCVETAKKVLNGEVPIQTAEAVQDIYWTAVSDKAQENRAFENGLTQKNLKESVDAMRSV